MRCLLCQPGALTAWYDVDKQPRDSMSLVTQVERHSWSQLIQEEPREGDKEGKWESGGWGSSHWDPRQWLRPPELREHLDA